VDPTVRIQTSETYYSIRAIMSSKVASEDSKQVEDSSWSDDDNNDVDNDSACSQDSDDILMQAAKHKTDNHRRRFTFDLPQQGTANTQSTDSSEAYQTYQAYQSVHDPSVPADQERQILLLM
jgi:hypothetical protein